ncbi:YybH family protein [Planctomicrobium sp. SH661]|uniref:YybH family protein n=1 Tax=Planctomicrobium sp. SH661 TaxID=3448124 RepID=UPI003F5AF791
MQKLKLFACVGILGIGSTVLAQTPAVRTAQPVAESPEEKSAHALGDVFAKAFNAHDAAALAALWKPDAEYVSAGSQTPVMGRPAIEAAYTKLFKDDPKCTVSVRAQSATKSEDGSQVTLAGILDEIHTDGSRSSSHFVAHLVAVKGGKWLISKVEETELPVIQAPAIHLKKLDWLLGTWIDDEQDQKIVTTFSVAPGGNFYTREYRRVMKNQVVQKGIQTIGWDQDLGCFRTWLFDEDGSFGQGFWSQDGETQWSVKIAIQTPDGRRGALTQILRSDADGNIEIQNVDQQFDGASLPNSLVSKLVKQAAPEPPK